MKLQIFLAHFYNISKDIIYFFNQQILLSKVSTRRTKPAKEEKEYKEGPYKPQPFHTKQNSIKNLLES